MLLGNRYHVGRRPLDRRGSGRLLSCLRRARPAKRVGGKRRYDEEVLRRLALIAGAKRAGFTLGEIRTLLHGFPAETGAAQRWQSLASEKLGEVEEALRCERASLDECARLLSER